MASLGHRAESLAAGRTVPALQGVAALRTGIDVKPVHQTIFDELDGNCLQACIASVLDLPLDAVPNEIARSDWWESVNAWLIATRGLYLVAFRPGKWKPTGIHLTSGAGPRGMEHVVVSEGGRMIHDPHPAGIGLEKVRMDWIFVSLDPARSVPS